MKRRALAAILAALVVVGCSPAASPAETTAPPTTTASPVTTASSPETAPPLPERLLPAPYVDIDFADGIVDRTGHMSADSPDGTRSRLETAPLTYAGQRVELPHLYLAEAGAPVTLSYESLGTEQALQALLADGFTLEAVLVNGNRLGADATEQCMTTAGQSGGFGFSVNRGKYTFGVYTGDGWKRISLSDAYDTAALTHLLGVYDADAATLILYVNGERVGETPAPGRFRPAQQGCWSRIILGGDTGAKGTELHAANTRIADFKLYPAAMTSAQASTAYAASVEALTGAEPSFTLRYLAKEEMDVLLGEPIFASLAQSYADIPASATALVSPPTVWQRAGVDSTAATVLFDLALIEGKLHATTADGRDLGALHDAVKAIAGRQIPAFALRELTLADALVDFINHNRIGDCFVLCADVPTLRRVSEATRAARPVLDATGRAVDPAALFLEASACGTKAVLLDAPRLTQDNVLAMRARSLTVFAALADASQAAIHDAIFAGVGGIVTADSAAVLAKFASITDRTLASPALMVAHRGDYAHCPDNTLRSLIAAAESGASATEFDVYMTIDGHLVLNHDKTTSLWDKKLDCTKSTRAELEALVCTDPRATAEDRMTFYDEVMAYFAANHTNMIFTVEIKDQRPAVVDRLVEVTREYGMLDRTLFISMGDNVTRYAYETYGVAIQDNLSTSYPTLAETCLDLAALPTSYYCQWSSFNPKLAQGLRHRGIKCSPWTTGSASDNDLHYARGVDEFTTNVPHHSDSYVRFLRVKEAADGRVSVSAVYYDGHTADVTAQAEFLPLDGSVSYAGGHVSGKGSYAFRLKTALPILKTYTYAICSPSVSR